MRARGRPSAADALVALPIVFLAVVYAWPVGAILARGFGGTGATSGIVRVLTDPVTWRVAGFTLGQAALSTVATLVAGLPVAALVARHRFRGRRLVEAGLMVPFVLPTIVVGAAFSALAVALGLDPQAGLPAIVAAHIFFNLAVVVRTVGGRWANLDPALEEAARTLGAGPLRTLLAVTLPRLRPAIGAAAVIVLLFSATSFGVVLLLGGPARATLEVEIHRATTQSLDLAAAAGLAIVQLVAVVATLAAYGRLQARDDGRAQRLVAAGTRRRALTGPLAAALATWTAIVIIGIAAPLTALVVRSLRTADGLGLTHYRALLEASPTTALAVAPRVAITNSLRSALAATVVAVVVGLAASVAATGGGRLARLIDRALMLPLGTSSVTVGLGFLVAFGRWLTPRGAAVLVPLAQALIATPFVVRTTLPALRAIDASLREAAAVLGAAPARVRREIDLPIVARATAVAAGFAFAIALGEFGATVFLARATDPTVPTAILRLLGRPGLDNVGQASALSVVLAGLTALVVLAVDRARLGRIGSF